MGIVPEQPHDVYVGNPLVVAVVNALHVLGCVTRSNAAALLSLTTVRLSAEEREAVLALFPLSEHRQVTHWSDGPGGCGVECACGVTFGGFDSVDQAVAMLDLHATAGGVR